MKVLITGGTGFIGSHLTEMLVKHGHEVRVLAREQSNIIFLENLGVEVILGDITDIDTVDKAIKGCQQVYHLAAKTSRTKSSTRDYYAVNVEGTKKLVHAALRANVERMIYASTVSVYGIINDSYANEKTQPKPSTFYGKSKLLSEEVLLSSHQKEGLPVVIARLPFVLGARGLSWLGMFQALSNRNFRIIGNGKNHFNLLVSVKDIINGLYACANTKNILGQIYILGGKEETKFNDFIQMIAKELKIDHSYSHIPDYPFRILASMSQFAGNIIGFDLPMSSRYDIFLTSKILDISKAQRELNYEPKVSVKEGIQETIAWYQEQGYL